MDRVVLVTGGNRGIGYAIAAAFLAQGDRVAVTARSGAGPDGALTVHCDVTVSADVDAAFDRIEQELGPISVCVAKLESPATASSCECPTRISRPLLTRIWPAPSEWLGAPPGVWREHDRAG
jgi:NAD(P)-dependent dehydrogenase (short-subunit alcohol dehydrogenase family)